MNGLARAAHLALLLLSGWLVVSPWALDFKGDGTAAAVTITVGAALIVAVVASWLRPQNHWPRRLEFALVVFLYVSPWLFGYPGTTAAAADAWMFSTVIGYVGIVQVVELRSRRETPPVTLGGPRATADVPVSDRDDGGDDTAATVELAHAAGPPHAVDPRPERTRDAARGTPVAARH